VQPHDLKIELHQKQRWALEAPAEEILYGGAAGGGKSFLMRAAPIVYSLAIPGLNTYLFRRNFPDLQKNHMEGPSSFHVLLAPLVEKGLVEIVQKEVRFYNGARIFLCHLQHTKNLATYQGAEIHNLELDEATHFTEEQYRYLRGRCRLGSLQIPKGIKQVFPRCLLGTNPGGVGHLWCRRSFVDKGPYRIHRTKKEDGGMRRVFIPASSEDNPTLLENDPTYMDRLEGLGDPVLIRAMRDGDWKIVAGAVFGARWRDELHTCDPFPIPRGWRVWRGADDGYAAPAAVHWFTQDPNTKTVYVIDELYKSRMLPEEMATKIIARDLRIRMADGQPYGEPISGILDSAAFADTGQQNAIPRGNVLNKMGCRFKACEKWPGSRVDRVRHFHLMMSTNPTCPRKLPRLRFFHWCKRAIETIPALPRDPHDIEDVDTDAEDHAFDSVSYGLMWKRPANKKTKVVGI
jgi:hypothetical protein